MYEPLIIRPTRTLLKSFPVCRPNKGISDSIYNHLCVNERQPTYLMYSAFNFGTSFAGTDLCLLSVRPGISPQSPQRTLNSVQGSREHCRQVPRFTEGEEEDAL